MPRIRSFKPEAPQHRKVGRLSIWARWLWFVMVTQADDYGRLVADPGQLRLLAFGYDKLTDDRVTALLEELAATGLIRLYAVEGVPYADFPSWDAHQRISHRTESKYPPYQDSGNFRKLPETSGLARARGSRSKEGIKEQGGDQGEDHGPHPPAGAGAALTPTTSFDRFWAAYPRKTAKEAARRAWARLGPDAALEAEILAAISRHAASEDWRRDEGRFIPHPATWLNGRRWTDEPRRTVPVLMNPRTQATLQQFVDRRPG